MEFIVWTSYKAWRALQWNPDWSAMANVKRLHSNHSVILAAIYTILAYGRFRWLGSNLDVWIQQKNLSLNIKIVLLILFRTRVVDSSALPKLELHHQKLRLEASSRFEVSLTRSILLTIPQSDRKNVLFRKSGLRTLVSSFLLSYYQNPNGILICPPDSAVLVQKHKKSPTDCFDRNDFLTKTLFWILKFETS